jgi:hypothetical protein
MNKLADFDVRFLFLLGMLIFLPSVEALKNLFAILFVFSWIFIAIRNKNWGGRWRIIDSIFLFWILADLLVSINAIITHDLSGSNFRDILRFTLIAWVLSRTYFSKERLIQSALIAIFASIVTLIFGYYQGGGELRELHSVGHINHSAIFLLLTYSISLALLIFEFSKCSSYQKIILSLMTIALFLATVDTESRATFGLIIFITLVNFLYLIYRVRQRSMIFLLFGIIFIIGLAFILSPPDALKRIKNENYLEDITRKQINEYSYYVFKYAFEKNPLFGIGFGNYNQIDIEDIKPLIIEEKGSFDSSLYRKAPHPHNVYFNYLTGGGLIITAIFMWFWFYVVWIMIKLIIKRENEWIIVASGSVVIVNLVIGLVNTTLHHEHAILSMFVLGILISQFRMSELIKELVE